MEKSGFFHSVNGDRKYKADFFAEYFSSFIGNGVFPNPSTGLQVIANNDMSLTLKAGQAWINGYYYCNTDDLLLHIDFADGILNRIDRIVLRYDTIDRQIKAVIKKGQFASTPVTTNLERNADAYEIAIADIQVNAGAIKISQADITDLRLDKNLCGIVHGTVDQVDTTAIFNQFQDWYSQKKASYDNDIAKWTEEKKRAFDKWYIDNTTAFLNQINNWYTDRNNDFNIWFDSIKGNLDGDIAANLTAKTLELEKSINKDKEDLSNFKKSIASQMSDMATLKDKNTDVKYKLVVVDGKPFLEVVEL